MTTLANIRLAASPTTWGVDFADNPRNPAWNRVLDEIELAVSTPSMGSVELLARKTGSRTRTRIPWPVHGGNLRQPIFVRRKTKCSTLHDAPAAWCGS